MTAEPDRPEPVRTERDRQSRPLSELDDVALVRLMSVSHEPALAALYDRYGRLVYSVAYRVLGDGPLAEEVALDTFMRVWDNAASYRRRQAKVRTWLSSIARNRAIDVARRRGVRLDHGSLRWADVVPGRMPSDPHPDDTAARRDAQARVRAAVQALPERQREALALAFFQGFSHREVAAALNEPLGTVKTRIRTAMMSLRESLADLVEEA